MKTLLSLVQLLLLVSRMKAFVLCFSSLKVAQRQAFILSASSSSEDLDDLLTARLPTSVDDQVRQAAFSLGRASVDGIHRHHLSLLLPLIGATDLDDWPGGTRQMMQAAEPLIINLLKTTRSMESFAQIPIDQSDGVYCVLAQATEARDDTCAVLLPSCESLQRIQADLETQVGPTRDLIVVNPQWKRLSDFGGALWGTDEKAASYAESYHPTFSLTSYICEGESVRILRAYPGPWRVFLRASNDSDVVWNEIGRKDVIEDRPRDWRSRRENKRDGGCLFDYGMPSYAEIADMITSRDGYIPKNPAERAAAAFNFINDTI